MTANYFDEITLSEIKLSKKYGKLKNNMIKLNLAEKSK
jgi:hypothetical protein